MTKMIVACDFSCKQELFNLLNQFDQPIYVKLGMEIIYKFGFELIKEIKQQGHKIFLDLKLCDIPNTVYEAMKNLAQLDVDIIDVHAFGGIEMMKQAKQAVQEVNPNIKVIAITILTSLDKEALNKQLNIQGDVLDACLYYAKNAKLAGLDGVVCSVFETQAIKAICGNDFLCVTPGIRLTTEVQDQKRVASPELAKQQGVDYIVVGRAITTSSQPLHTYKQIEEMLNV